MKYKVPHYSYNYTDSESFLQDSSDENMSYSYDDVLNSSSPDLESSNDAFNNYFNKEPLFLIAQDWINTLLFGKAHV